MRLVRHLTFSNVIAVVALFIALGGAAYAGAKINGASIKNGSIGGGKLKNETIGAGKLKKGTITGAQIAPGTIDGTQINVTTLATVPAATSAGMAQSSQTANSAKTADSATTADTAKSAESATHADEADTATDATEADVATNSDHATEADKLGGATRASLTVGCSSNTEFYGGMCWDKTTQPTVFWLVAVDQCGKAGGRLPTIEELIAFVLRPGEQVEEQTWSGDLADKMGSAEDVFTTDENGREKSEGSTLKHGFRCVFPLNQPQ
jgi:hypothetical protein